MRSKKGRRGIAIHFHTRFRPAFASIAVFRLGSLGDVQSNSHRDLLEGNVMIPPLDVFAIEDGEHKWLACAETQAKALELIGNRGPGSYFVFSQETGNRIFFEVVARVRR